MPIVKNPPGPYQSLGNRIREARERAGLSQESLAPLAGTSRRHIMRIEGGHHRPRPDLLGAIAAAVGTTPDELAGDDSEEPG